MARHREKTIEDGNGTRVATATVDAPAYRPARHPVARPCRMTRRSRTAGEFAARPQAAAAPPAQQPAAVCPDVVVHVEVICGGSPM